MIQDKIFFDEKDPTGVSYNTPFTVYGSYEGRLWSKTPSGTIKYYTQNSDLSVYATTGSNSFNGNQTVTGSLTVTEGITGTATTASYVEYASVANKPTLVSSSAQIVEYNVFATTGSNQFDGSQAVTGSLTVTGQVVAQTLNVQQVTSSIVFSSGSNIFGNSVSNTQQFTGSLQVSGSSHYVLGNVGVGIAIPTNPLHIASNTLSQLNIQALSGNTNAQINLEPTGTGIALIGPANNVDFAFRTNATERLRITSGGNVGIGTNDPQSVLNGFSSSARGLAISNTYPFIGLNDTDGGNFYVGTQANLAYVWNGGSDAMIFATNNAERMRITSGGNVLIGTPTSNNHKLEIIGGATSGLRIDVNSGVSGIAMSPGAEFNIDQPGVGGGTFKINSSGNVGIGTASPAEKLDIQAARTANLTLLKLGTNNASTGNGDKVNIDFYSYENNYINSRISREIEVFSTYAGALTFATGASNSVTERMRITSGGYLKASNTGTYILPSTNVHEFNTSTNNEEILYHYHSNTDPYGLHVYFNSAPNNGSNYFQRWRDGSATRAWLYSNGGFANYQANDTNLSDERTKKDIAPLESYWDKFKNIEIVKFKYKDQTHDDYNIGVIAQQVEAVAPEFVDIDGWDEKPKLDEEGNTIVSEEEPLKSIYTADLHHATIKVLQEAMAKIESLESILQRNNIS
jgi:hypothetical protein